MELDNVINEIRDLPGFEEFLVGPTFEDLSSVANPDPIIYLLSVRDGGLAFLVDGENVTVTWLPELTEVALHGVVTEYLQACSRLEDPRLARTMLDATTQWLWDAIIGPILPAIDVVESITLIPTGLLRVPPLHAAWTEDPSTPTGRRYFLDVMCCTYAPNARVLRAARRIAERLTPRNLLAVVAPEPTTALPLPYAALETSAAAGLGVLDVTTLRGEQATRSAVLAALPGATMVHFACHSVTDLDNQMDHGGILLSGDERLTVRDLLGLELATRLAVLSSSETALQSVELPDEVVGLPVGLLQAGVAGVIGSLRDTSDIATILLIVDFYWRLEREAPVKALHHAQRWMREYHQ